MGDIAVFAGALKLYNEFLPPSAKRWPWQWRKPRQLRGYRQGPSANALLNFETPVKCPFTNPNSASASRVTTIETMSAWWCVRSQHVGKERDHSSDDVGAGGDFGETSCDGDVRRGNCTGDSGSQREPNSETIRHADDNIATVSPPVKCFSTCCMWRSCPQSAAEPSQS